MSSANTHPDDYGPPTTAAGTLPRTWPVIEEVGMFDTRGMDLEFHVPPPLPREENPRVKSQWLEKQLNHHGRHKI